MKRLNKHRHWGEHAAVAALLLGVASDWLPIPELARRIAGGIAVLAVTVGIMLTFAHQDGGPCEGCLRDMPLDGQERADRRTPWLRRHHRLADHLRNSLLHLGAVLGLFGLSLLFDKRSVPALLLGDLAVLLIVGRIVLGVLHRRLSPWCPWCHWGGGGGDDGPREPSPDPSVPEQA